MLNTNYQLKLLCLAILFALVAFFVQRYPINQLDLGFSHLVQHFQPRALNKIMLIISSFGNIGIAVFCVLATAILLVITKHKREAIFVIAISFTGVITYFTKIIFNRARPTSEQVNLLDSYQNNSFPSGHTLSYVVFFGFLIFIISKIKPISKWLRCAILTFAYVMITMGPLSRIYLGAHWLTDVLGGVIIGWFYLVVLKHYYKKGLEKRNGDRT